MPPPRDDRRLEKFFCLQRLSEIKSPKILIQMIAALFFMIYICTYVRLLISSEDILCNILSFGLEIKFNLIFKCIGIII